MPPDPPRVWCALHTINTTLRLSGEIPELCAGVVKGTKIYPKNQTQHYADLEMLSDAAELHPAFTNPSTHNPKRLECIRVDGATDEGPSIP